MADLLTALAAWVLAVLGPPAPASFDDLPVGPAPAVAYVDRGTHVDPHGRRTPLPDEHGISAVVPYDRGFLVTDNRWFEGATDLALVRDGRRVPWRWDAHCTSGRPATSPDGRYVAWTALSCPESGDGLRSFVVRARADGA